MRQVPASGANVSPLRRAFATWPATPTVKASTRNDGRLIETLGHPAPPLDDKAKAAAEEKKAKDAAAADAVKALQAKAEDRVAARYFAEQKVKGKAVTPQMGPTVAAAAPAKAVAPAAKGAPAVAPPKK